MRRLQAVWMLVLSFFWGYSVRELLLRIEGGSAGVHTATDIFWWVAPFAFGVAAIQYAWRATAQTPAPPKPGD